MCLTRQKKGLENTRAKTVIHVSFAVTIAAEFAAIVKSPVSVTR